MEDKPSAGSHPSRIPVSAPKYLQRPRDPLKDGSIFKMGPRVSHGSSSQPYTDTRQPSSLGMSPAGDMGGASIPPLLGMTGTPGMATMQTPGTGQLSRSEIARQIRANFDNLVRASPLPRAVERLVTPSAGRLAALAPPWLQTSPSSALQEAQTLRHLLHIKSHPQLEYATPGPGSVPSNVCHMAPPTGPPSKQEPCTVLHVPADVIRPIPLAPSFGCSPDALYTLRPSRNSRDPRLLRSLGQAISHAAALGSDRGQTDPAQDALTPLCQALPAAATGAQSRAHGQANAGQDVLLSLSQGSPAEFTLEDRAEADVNAECHVRREVGNAKVSTAPGNNRGILENPVMEQQETPMHQLGLSERAGLNEVGSEVAQSDSGRPETAGAEGQLEHEEQGVEQDQDQSDGKARTPGGENVHMRQPDTARISPGQWVWAIQAADAQTGVPTFAAQQGRSDDGPGILVGEAVTLSGADEMACTGQTAHCSQTSEVSKDSCQGDLPEQQPAEEPALAAAPAPSQRHEGCSDPLLRAGSLCRGGHESPHGKEQQELTQPAARIAQSDQVSIPLGSQRPTRAADMQKSKAKASSAQTRSNAYQQESKARSAGCGKAEAAEAQVSRTGRIRAPPLAFWANERLSRDANQTGGRAIERGFSDQLAQQCKDFSHSSPAGRPKKEMDAAEPGRGRGRPRKVSSTQPQSTQALQKSKGVKRKQPEVEPKLADAGTASDQAPVISLTAAAQRPETTSIRKNGRRFTGYHCDECRSKHQGHCGTEKAAKSCLRRGLANSPKPGCNEPQFVSCKECRKAHKGHCGTERAVKSCLRRRQADTAQPDAPAAQTASQDQPRGAGLMKPPGAARTKKQVQNRTLGVKAQLDALARRPSDAEVGKLPNGAADIVAQAVQRMSASGQQLSSPGQLGQRLGTSGQPGQVPSPSGKSKRSASVRALHQAKIPKATLENGDSSGYQGAIERTSKKQRNIRKHATVLAQMSDEPVRHSSGPATDKKKEETNGTVQKLPVKGKNAKKRNAQPGALEDCEEPSMAASGAQGKAVLSKRKVAGVLLSSSSSAAKHAVGLEIKPGKGSGPGQDALPSKLRKLTKAGNTDSATQEVRRLDLGANASTSDGEDCAKADDCDDWSEEQMNALQGAYLVGEDPTKPNFWHNVAQHVPGKTAGECQNRMWAGYPTPKASKKTAANSGAYALAAEADSDDSPLLPPPRHNAAGGRKKPAPAATRKWARQVRWHERASQAASAVGPPQQPEQAQPAAGSNVNPTLLTAMQQQQRTDRYIDALIRKRGPLHKWAKGAMARRVAPAHALMPLSHPELQGTVAAIASATQDAGNVDADEETSDRDLYWSDDCCEDF